MFNKEYYCLVAGLPDLFFNNNKLNFTSLKFRMELKKQLWESDYRFVEYLYLPFDNQNLLYLLFGKNSSFNCHGNFPKRVLEPDTLKTEKLPDYLHNYLSWFNAQENKHYTLEKEIKLHTLFYDYLISVKNDFLKNWFLFDLNIKNIQTAINCKQYNYPLENHLIMINTGSDLIQNLLSHRFNHELFEEELPFAEQIIRVSTSDVNRFEKEKSIERIKWNYLDNATFFHYFTIEKILSYVIKLIMIERWIKLDKSTGKELLNKLINEFKKSLSESNEFA